MQIVENLSRIVGRIDAIGPLSGRDGWDILTVLLMSAEAVDERAELLAQHAGGSIQIEAPRELLGRATVGDEIRGTVRVAGPGQIIVAPQAVAGEALVIRPG